MNKILFAVAVLLGLLGLYMAMSVSSTTHSGYSARTEMYGGEAGFSVQYNKNGDVQSVAVELSMDLIESAPEGELPPQIVRLEFPEDAKAQTFFDHLDVDYNPGGHPPGPYLVPHFDLHLYGITEESQLAIDCHDTVVIGGDLLPEHHIVTAPGAPPEGECVPEMGHHGIDLRSPELNPEAPQPFTKTMILGYYAGQFTFLEPMITKKYLMEKQSFTLPIYLPDQLPRETRYPTRFHAFYNENTHMFEFVFSSFEMR